MHEFLKACVTRTGYKQEALRVFKWTTHHDAKDHHSTVARVFALALRAVKVGPSMIVGDAVVSLAIFSNPRSVILVSGHCEEVRNHNLDEEADRREDPARAAQEE